MTQTYRVHLYPIVRVAIDVQAVSPEAALSVAADAFEGHNTFDGRVAVFAERRDFGCSNIEYAEDFDAATVDLLDPAAPPPGADYLATWIEERTAAGSKLRRTDEGDELVAGEARS